MQERLRGRIGYDFVARGSARELVRIGIRGSRMATPPHPDPADRATESEKQRHSHDPVDDRIERGRLERCRRVQRIKENVDTTSNSDFWLRCPSEEGSNQTCCS